MRHRIYGGGEFAVGIVFLLASARLSWYANIMKFGRIR
jgi:hypothetical protein